MVKPMEYRKLKRLLTEAGFTSRQGKGDHEVWSKGGYRVVLTQTRYISPGVTRKALQAIEAAQEE